MRQRPRVETLASTLRDSKVVITGVKAGHLEVILFIPLSLGS